MRTTILDHLLNISQKNRGAKAPPGRFIPAGDFGITGEYLMPH
jgi:hypothetical protein